MTTLFDSDNDDNEISFKTENEYAKKYDTWREKEELHKLEQKYGENPEDPQTSDSDSEDESDEPLEVSEEAERQFLKTLSLLKKKDPRIYNPDFKFFENASEDPAEVEVKQEEPVKSKKQAVSLAAAFADSDDDDDGGEIFTVQEKAIKPEQKEDSLKQYLTGQTPEEENQEELAALRALWSAPTLDQGETFLRDYILNKQYLEESEVPSGLDAEALAEDEARVEEQGQFERAYNFRFEEPDQEFLKRYPRTMNSVRPKDDRRAQKRAEVRTRKEEDKKRKMDEIARLKALKSKEIREKIDKIKQVTGNQELAFKESDIEGDFDPSEHDRQMKAIFDEQYYGDVDEEKPVFPDLDEELEIENWENYEEECAAEVTQDEPHCEDDGFNMDADYDPKSARTALMNEIQETLGKKRRNRKRKSKLAQLLATEKPTFIPGGEKTYREYMDEYYKLECEDVIAGDLPTRFKYREVVPNSFGLTIEEILLADDRELNRWASLKKTVKYRPEHVERNEVTTYTQKAADLSLKRTILPSLFKDIPKEPELVVRPDTKKKKKKKNKTHANDNEQTEQNAQDKELGESSSKKKKKKDKHNEVIAEDNQQGISQDDDHDATPNDTKQNKKKNYKDNINNEDSSTSEVVEQKVSKKKRKDKNKINKDTITNNDELNKKHNNRSINNNPESNKRKKINKNNVTVENTPKKQNGGVPSEQNKLKRKLDTQNNDEPHKKRKRNKKHKNNKSQGATSDNPLGKLSDERLKAFGLNPKKYRSFLKYKTF